ncbi:MAG: prolipoprotein diacylglyceryl transferase [Acidimicrobiia bacterium]|nr:prolipoprotein diacylglyceryl transferase [Acidimicrobiia bacterium]
MHPIVDLSLGGLHVVMTAYRLAFFVAIVAVPVTALLVGRWLSMPLRRLAVVLAAAGVAAVVGARLLAVTLAHDNGQGWAQRVTTFGAGDFALFGGLILGGVVGFMAARALGLDPHRAGDAVAAAIGVGIIVMRTGCFLAGCCFGKETSVAWGVTYPAGSPSHLAQIGSDPIEAVLHGPAAVHPIPLYEIGVALAGVGLVAVLLLRRAPAGSPLAAIVVWYSLWRLMLQPVRAVSEASAAPVLLWQLVFAAVAIGAIGYLTRILVRRGRFEAGVRTA